MRVGLLELVGRAMHDELVELLERALALEVLRQRRALVRLGDRPQRNIDLARRVRGRRRAGERLQARLEHRLEVAAQRQRATAPTPSLVDAGQAAVVQLVAAVERQLEVLAVERVTDPVRWAARRACEPDA